MSSPAVAQPEPTNAELPPQVQMVQMLAGFQISQALYAVAKLDIATALADGPRTVAELSSVAGTHEDSLRRLIRTLASIGLFADAGDGRVTLTPLGATLAAGVPGSVRNLALTWMETHYAPFGDLAHTIRTGEPAADHHFGRPYFDWLSQHPEQVATFTGAMADLTFGLKLGAMIGYRLPPGGVVADIGGADGALLLGLLGADGDPSRRGVIFDLPHVVPDAVARVAEAGLQDRIDVIGGDFFAAAPSADIYVMSMILHDWDDEGCARILRRIAESARRPAKLVVFELVVPPGDAPHMSKMIDLTMLGMLTGRERSAEEYRDLFARSGFELDRIVDTPTPMSIIEATLT